MQPLSRRYRKVMDRMAVVRSWLQDSERQLQSVLFNTRVTNYIWPIGTSVFWAAVVACLVTLGWMYGPDENRPWPAIGWLFPFVFVGTGGLIAWVWSGTICHRLRNELHTARRKEWARDPLYARARLILDALREFDLHYKRYEAWYVAVDEELQDSDEAAAARYHEFIVQAYYAINTGIDNWTRVVDLLRRQAAYLQQYPELSANVESTRLADLMALLNQPVEIPTVGRLPDPRRALEHEEALQEVLTGLDESALTQAIEAMPEKNSGQTA